MMRARGVWLFATMALVGACGSEGAPNAPDTANEPAPSASASTSNQPPPASNDAGPSSQLDADPLVGLWHVAGHDARGDYRGQVEVRHDDATPGAYRFIRDVRYSGITVEDGRELGWVFHGALHKSTTTSAGSNVTLDATLKRADFIVKRGTLERTAADGPVAITGALTLSSAGKVTGTIAGPDFALTDEWSARAPLPSAPIFVDQRTIIPAHAAPSATEKQTNFNLYSSYQGLDVVKPYTSRPEFQAAVHRHEIDTTDFDFYRANKNVLRVVDKVIDDISLAETRVRADAYRWTMAEKAERYQTDIETKFIDPSVGMMPHGGLLGATTDQMWESGDGSLWTAVYLGSQVMRYQVTGEAKAIANVELTLDAMLKLQEITGGDWSQFARTLRKARGAGNQWHAGTGPYAGLEWLDGGNNDMIKGLFYAYLWGWQLFCEGGKTGHESLCTRIRTNTKHLADDVVLGGSNAIVSQQTNKLLASWLYAVVTDDAGDAFSYKAKAEGYWAIVKVGIAATPVYYSQGIVDWSGTHLTFVGDVIQAELAKRINLGGDADAVVRAHIDASHKNLEKQRFPTWHFLKAALGTGAGPTSPFIKDAVSRMIEAQYPKMAFDVDRRISADFCMSPYPAVPWKGDWMSPTEDRTQALDTFPLFESGPSINYWMSGNEYRYAGGWEAPGGDYLELYWFARKYNLISGTD